MLTAYAAQQLHLEDRIGTIEVGKEGDVVLLNGDPFDSYTRVEKTIVDGIVYYDRTREAELRGQPVRPWVASALSGQSSGTQPAAPGGARGRPQRVGAASGSGDVPRSHCTRPEPRGHRVRGSDRSPGERTRHSQRRGGGAGRPHPGRGRSR